MALPREVPASDTQIKKSYLAQYKNQPLVKTLDKRTEYNQLLESDPVLGIHLLGLDKHIETLIEFCEQYDRKQNEEDSETSSEWVSRLLRCRFVLGMD